MTSEAASSANVPFSLPLEQANKLYSLCIPYEDIHRRVERMTTIGAAALHHHFPAINRVFHNEPQGSVAMSRYPDGSISHHGLPYEKYGEELFGHLATVGNSLVNECDLPEVALRLGNAATVLISQGQLFPNANKRTARAVRGLILKGAGGMADSINQLMSFQPPKSLEEIVLHQNITRLTSDFYERTDDLLDPIEADPQLGDILDAEQAKIATIANRSAGENKQPILDDQQQNLREHLAPRMGGVAANEIGFILLQKWYGPAALAIVGQDRSLDSLTSLDAQHIGKVNNELLKMRAKSLVNGLLHDGIFPMVFPGGGTFPYRWQPYVAPAA